MIGIILVFGLVAGVYYAYQRGESIRGAAPVMGPSTQEAPRENPAKDGTTNPDQQKTATPSTNGTNEIPQTGPSDSLYSVGALALLTFAGATYIRSRGRVRSL